jgi:hypothetical protein
MYAGEVAGRRGASVHRHVWSEMPPMPWGPRIEGRICGEVTAVLDAVGGEPLLTEVWVAAALDRALASRLSSHVVEVEGAGHNMCVPGPLTDSIAVLSRMVVAVEEFLDAIGWPG